MLRIEVCTDMNISEIAIANIQPAPYNPRKDLQPGDAEYEKLRAVIDRFDLVEPLVWNRRTSHLVGGHQRLKILKARGDVKVQAVVVDLNDAEERALNVALNQVQGDWDLPRLSELLNELKAADFDLSLTGWDMEELTALMAPYPNMGLIDEDTAPEPPQEPVSQTGDLFQCGRHTILCGDSTCSGDVARLLGQVRPTLMVTDPPYGVKYRPAWRNDAFGEANRSIGEVRHDDRADWREAWALFTGDVAYVWHAGTKAAIVAASLESCEFEIRSQIIWAKPHFVISRGHYHVQHEPCWYAVRQGKASRWQGDRTQATLWTIPNGLNQAGPRTAENELTGHGTQKPVECMRRPMLNHARAGEVVYDPFSGSGSTIIAAETTGRICYAMEIEPAYVDTAILRWESFSGQTATLGGDGRTFGEIAAERKSKS